MSLDPSPSLRPEVRDAFERALADLDTTAGLVRAAVAVARHEMPEADEADVLGRLEALADRVRRRAPGGSPKGRLAHLHLVLFEEEGFAGNSASYADPRNSYLPALLDTRLGIPVSLCLLYRAVAERVGLGVEGIGAPGHFLVRVALPREPLLVDPFDGGRALSPDEARARVARATGMAVPEGAEVLPAVDNRAWISRLLRNLEVVFRGAGRAGDLAAMETLRSIVDAVPGAR